MTEFDIEFLTSEDTQTRFVVRGITPAFANGIRRAILADVPTLSIDTVRFVENSSVMFDEQIGLRLGLVPLSSPPDEFEVGDSVTLGLSVEGPETAYSGDLQSKDAVVEPAVENVPIIQLKEDQRLELEAEAVLAVGKDHAKHQGGVAVGFRHLQRLDVGEERNEYADDDPRIQRGVVEVDGELVSTAEFDNDLQQEYPDHEVSVTDVENAYVFDVESDGSLSALELVGAAITSIEDRAAELEEAVAL